MKEESNSGYLSNQSKILNDYVGIGEHQSLSDHSCYFYLYANESLKEMADSGFAEAFERSILAKEFKLIYER